MSSFTGSIPERYDAYMVPLFFEHYARDLAARVAARAPARVLELAAGTGVVTRALAAGTGAAITATDLHQEMIDRAAAIGTARPVTWQRADALQLPFEDASFDAVVCQFGVMFFPDRARAFAEARRVLADGGTFLFNTWDGLDTNELADEVTRALAIRFPDDPPRFMARLPHGYADPAQIAADLRAGGFTAPPQITTLGASSRAACARDVAIALCQGTPLYLELEAREPGGIEAITDACAAAIAARFGGGAIDAAMCAHVVAAAR